MKKFKKYIVLLFLPIMLLGCVQKGVSDSVNEDTTNVAINTTLSSKIEDNIALLKNLYNGDSSLISKTLLYNTNSTKDSIIEYLSDISDAYTNGNITKVELSNLASNLETYKTSFFTANNLLEYENMLATYNNIQIELNALNEDSSSDAGDIDDLEKIEGKISAYISEIKVILSNNSYYIELEYSKLLKQYLQNNISSSNSSLTYEGLLKKYSLLDDEALSDKYSRLIGFIEPQYQILNNNNVITSVDTLSITSPITKKYRIKSNDILTTAQITELKSKLSTLIGYYENYSTNTSNISTSEYNFYTYERSLLVKLAAVYSKYYTISVNGTKLKITYESRTDGVTTSISEELERIYKLPLATSKLSQAENQKVYILYKNINSMIDDLEDYDALNPTTIYSACVTTAQLLQMLKDNQTFIESVVDLNN